jgi:anti-sigma factor RsiW
MTCPGPHDLPGPWPDILAAYADGELDAPARTAVERWLASHPRAVAELRAQKQLSPENWPLWQQAEPPLPTEATWAAVRELVADAVHSPVTPAARSEPGWWWRTRFYFSGGVGALVAAGLLFAVTGRLFFPPPPPPVPQSAPEVVSGSFVEGDDPLAGIAVLPLADADDVDIHRVAGGGGGWLQVGEPPLAGPLALAGEEDVQLEEADPHPAWPGGTPRMVTAPGDAAMIFAAGPR